jgi:hypothetical protein
MLERRAANLPDAAPKIFSKFRKRESFEEKAAMERRDRVAQMARSEIKSREATPFNSPVT